MSAEQILPNEASVEWKVVLPLLQRLGYDLDDIHPQFPVELRKGRRGRKPAADVAVFSGRPHTRDTSLIAVEAKKPDEPMWDAKEQAESYQIGIRAPFTLIIDGKRLELWQFQPTKESTCILAFQLVDLEANFGTLHAILSKPAAIAYCRSLDPPNAAERATDWSDYASAELQRVSGTGPRIARTLVDSATSTDIGSGTLLDTYPSGAIVTGASGLGKTSLSIELLVQALEQSVSPLALHVPLTDIAAGQSIAEFCVARLDAHKPGTTIHRLREIMRDAGLLLLLDACDRLPVATQDMFAAELRNLKRDFPKLQIFLFSRAGARPPLSLPTLELKPLTSDEQFDLVKITRGQDAACVWNHAPRRLRELCRVPLLLELANDYKAHHQQFPPSLLDLFENWLAVTVDPDGRSASRRIVRERALRKIATARASRTVPPALALDVLSQHGGDAALFDELIQTDAIRVDGQTVNFPHEALADYLLALDITDQIPEGAIARLSEVRLEPGSYFPVLLMNASCSADFQAQLWQRLEQCDLDTYLAVLRYKASPIGLGTIDPTRFATSYLTELVDGIEAPLRTFFPQIASLARTHLVNENCDALRIVGNASPTSVYYSLSAYSSDSKRAEIGFDKEASRHCSVNLDLSRLRADSGRLIGMRRVRDTIESLVASRALHAGPALASERVLGRLRYLAREYEFGLAPDVTLDAAVTELEPLRGKYADCPPGRADKRFWADDLFDDLAILQRAGQPMPRPWWRIDMADVEPDWSDEAAKRYALDAHFHRAQVVYAEIVAGNFASVATSLDFYSMLPVRWMISGPAHPADQDAWYTFTNMPVADWSLAGATLSTVKSMETAADWRAHYDSVLTELSRLGRLRAKPSVGWQRSALPRCDGEDRLGNYDGETSALRTAFKWLEDDLKRLFRDLP